MTAPKQEAQAALFYEFSQEERVPQDHHLRSIDPGPLIQKRQTLPFIPVFDNSKRKDGTWSRTDCA